MDDPRITRLGLVSAELSDSSGQLRSRNRRGAGEPFQGFAGSPEVGLRGNQRTTPRARQAEIIPLFPVVHSTLTGAQGEPRQPPLLGETDERVEFYEFTGSAGAEPKHHFTLWIKD